jgi:tetratricopeptide (TPR) repeat protein
MEGRGYLRLSVCLLIAAAGCQQEVVSPNSAPTSFMSIVEPKIKKPSDKPKDLSPSVLVSYGNFEAGEAFSDRTEPDRRQQLCESARVDYEKALTLDPKCVPAYQGLARLYRTMRDLPLAVENYQKALKLTPTSAPLWYELSLCYNCQKNWGPALECLDRAARIQPSNRSYVNAMGVVFAEAGRYEDSLKCFARSGGEAMGYYRLAQTLNHLQKPELSRRYLEVALQKDPSLAPPIQQVSYQPAVSPQPNPSPPGPTAERPAREAPSRVPSPPPIPTAHQPSSPAPAADNQPAPQPLLLPPVPLLSQVEE